MVTPNVDLEAMVRELTEGHVERTHFDQHRGGTRYGADHRVPVPPLLDQLRHREPVRGEGRRGTSGSRVPVSLEAIDTAVRIDLAAARIDLAAARWVRDLGEDPAGDTAGCLLQLRALSESADRCQRATPWRDPATGEVGCCTWHALEVDVRSWWLSARVVSGWDGRPWSPYGSCPVCEHRGGLRVRLGDQTALCVECRAVWGPTNIGVLAEHIRSEVDGRAS